MKTIEPNAIRVAIMSDAAAHRNGVGSYYRDLSEQLKPVFEKVALVSPTRRSAGMYIMSLPLPGDATQSLRVPNLPKITAYLNKLNPHVIVAATPGPFGLYAYYYSRRAGIPLCTGLHTDYSGLTDMYWRGGWGRIAKRYLDLVNEKMTKGSDVVAAVNEDLCCVAEGIGAKEAVKIGSLISRSYIKNPPHAPHGITRVIYAGRLAQEKNIPAVLDAARALPHLSFTIAGDGPLREPVKHAAAQCPNLRYAGWLSRHALREQLDRHDILVLPSESETFGTVAMEAAARRKIALVSAECGILNWPDFQDVVQVIGPNETLAAALQRVASLPATEITRLGENSGCAAHAFNATTCTQWTVLLQRLSASSTRVTAGARR